MKINDLNDKLKEIGQGTKTKEGKMITDKRRKDAKRIKEKENILLILVIISIITVGCVIVHNEKTQKNVNINKMKIRDDTTKQGTANSVYNNKRLLGN